MWPHLLCTALGVWLMAAPQVLGYGGAARTNDHIVGPLIVTFACTAAFQSVRGVRFVTTLLGAWLVIAPFVLGYEREPLLHSLVIGAATVALSLIRGPMTEKFGGGWSMLWRPAASEARR
jgi:hypothetical protein